MENKSRAMGLVFLALGTLAAGCSGNPTTPASEIGMNGPAVVGAKPEPKVIELTQALTPKQYAQIVADVKDFNGQVQEVRVKFLHVPIELPMEHVAGTTWQAVIPPDQLRRLAVNGQTVKYQLQIVARDDQGRVGASNTPVEIEVKAPDVTKTG